MSKGSQHKAITQTLTKYKASYFSETFLDWVE